MGCGCSKGSAPVVARSSKRTVQQTVTTCGVTLDLLLQTKNTLENKKTPDNSYYVNEKLGLIQTMINSGSYCLYDIQSMLF